MGDDSAKLADEIHVLIGQRVNGALKALNQSHDLRHQPALSRFIGELAVCVANLDAVIAAVLADFDRRICELERRDPGGGSDARR